MEIQRFVRNIEDVFLHVVETLQAHHFLQGLRVADHKIAKTEVVEYGSAEVYWQLLGILVQKYSFKLLCGQIIGCLRGFDYYG